jgi:hypothetical protein
MVTEYSTTQEDVKYPEEIKFAVGDSVVAMMLEARDQQTRNGMSKLVTVVTREKPETARVIWWKAVPLPPALCPFVLTRVSEMKYRLQVAETEEEKAGLWSEGVFPTAAAASAPGKVQKVKLPDGREVEVKLPPPAPAKR